MPLSDSDVIDLLKSTKAEQSEGKMTQIATTLQNYELMGRVLKEDKVQFESGHSIERRVMTSDSGNASNVATVYDTDEVAVGDVLQTISIPWKRTKSYYLYDLHEIMVNRSGSKLIDLKKVRRADGMIGLAKKLEDAFVSKPTDSTDKVTPFGMTYWVVKNASEGFNGGNPSGFSAGAGGLDSATYTRWRNWSRQYTNFTKPDLIKGMRKAYNNIQFKSPTDIPGDDGRNKTEKDNGQRYRIYCNEASRENAEDIGEAQNDNLGRDLAVYDGKMVFRGNPVVWLPALDADTSNPFYFLDMDSFYPVVMTGDYMRESDPAPMAGRHRVFVIWIDLTWNMFCKNRRCNAVLYQ